MNIKNCKKNVNDEAVSTNKACCRKKRNRGFTPLRLDTMLFDDQCCDEKKEDKPLTGVHWLE